MPSKKNEQTSKQVASLASKALRTGEATKQQVKTLAASVLTQTPNKPAPKRGK